MKILAELMIFYRLQKFRVQKQVLRLMKTKSLSIGINEGSPGRCSPEELSTYCFGTHLTDRISNSKLCKKMRYYPAF